MENPLSNNPEATPTAPIEPQTDGAPTARPAIRTLHSDIASSVRSNNISLTKIALAQQAKNADLPFVAEEKTHFWSAWSIGTILLIVGGFIILGGAIFIAISKTVSLPFTEQAPLTPTLVPVESQTAIDTTRMPLAELLRTISAFADSTYSSPVTLEALIVQEMTTATSTDGEHVTTLTPMSLERFLERLNSRAPGRLVRSTGPEMTLGRAGETPFLITKTSSYEAAFAGMLEWEPRMAEDLPFLAQKQATNDEQRTKDQETTTPKDTASSSAPGTSSVPAVVETASTTPIIPTPTVTPPPTWKDIIVRNKDVRALVTHDGTPLLLYAFPKNGILVITQSPEAFMLIIDALNAPVFGI